MAYLILPGSRRGTCQVHRARDFGGGGKRRKEEHTREEGGGIHQVGEESISATRDEGEPDCQFPNRNVLIILLTFRALCLLTATCLEVRDLVL